MHMLGIDLSDTLWSMSIVRARVSCFRVQHVLILLECCDRFDNLGHLPCNVSGNRLSKYISVFISKQITHTLHFHQGTLSDKMIPKSARNQVPLCVLIRLSPSHHQVISRPIALTSRVRCKIPFPLPLVLINWLVMHSKISTSFRIAFGFIPWWGTNQWSTWRKPCSITRFGAFVLMSWLPMHTCVVISSHVWRTRAKIEEQTHCWRSSMCHRKLDTMVTKLWCRNNWIKVQNWARTVLSSIDHQVHFGDQRWYTIGTRANYGSRGPNTKLISVMFRYIVV